ncbi:MAG: cysteine--tRNA ligase, partial [Candidatus Omnitrophica bacterium]|nr:cysteine--tRNA ligase [Candidatus Omnitrophota bacterium]
YNSLSRKKEELVPLKPKEIKMYVCGPTVYDEAHIGHARSAYIFDVIRRYLLYRGYKVTFVRNVTDVDDKIIDKARREFGEGDLNEAVRRVSAKYLGLYHKDMHGLGILDPDFEPKATEYVGEDRPLMQKFIGRLIDNGCAYASRGDVYFDIKKADGYGKLSNQEAEKMETGARVASGENKRDPLDFALWKSAKPGEPAWDSPWGKGRPGWHIECSVMSSDILGDEFDIHGGGIDLIFPHHENEIAQSEGAGKKFARYWIHHGLLTIEGQKMSKSLGNFVTIGDFISRYRNPDLLKLFFLSAHYSHPIDYSSSKIEEARCALERIAIFMDKANAVKFAFLRTLAKKIPDEIMRIKNKFLASLDDDFNTPGAMACVFELVNAANRNISRVDFVIGAKVVLKEMLSILNITLEQAESVGQIGEEQIKSRIADRLEAKRARDYALADKIRKDLELQGVILEDTREGTTWRRKI